MRLLLPILLLTAALPLPAAEPPSTPQLRIEAGMHTAMIWRLSTDAAGRLLLTCSEDKTARLWSLPPFDSKEEADLLRTLRIPMGSGNEGKLFACALSPDGSLAAVAGWTKAGFEGIGNHNVYLFDTTTGRLLRRFAGLPNVVNDLAFSQPEPGQAPAQGGRWLAAALGAGNGLRLFDTASGALLAQDTDYGQRSNGLDWWGSGQLVTTCFDAKLRLYDLGELPSAPLAQLQTLKPSHTVTTTTGKEPFAARFSPDGRRIAVGFNDLPKVALHRRSDLSLESEPDADGVNNGDVSSVTWTQSGHHLLAGGRWDVGGPNPLRLWPMASSAKPRDLQVGMSDTIMDLRPLPDGRVVFGTYDPAWGLVNPTAPDEKTASRLMGRPPIADHRASDANFRLSADGSVVLFGYEPWAKSPATFSLGARQLRLDPPAQDLGTLRSPLVQSRAVPVTDWKHELTPKLRGQPIALNAYETSRCLTIAPSEAFFVLGTDYALRCYAADGTLRWKAAVPGACWAVNLSADGKWAVAAYGDGTIRWHDVEHDGQELLAFFPHADRKRWVLWTPEGYYDCSADGESLIGWHVNRGKDQAADFYPASQFREQFYRPDVIQAVLATRDVAAAVKQADAARGLTTPAPTATQVIQQMAPPVVELTTGGTLGELELPAGTTKATIRYRVRGSTNEPVRLVSLRVDGRPVEATAPVPADASAEAEATVPVPDKDCIIAVLAENRYAVSEPALLRIRRATAPSATPEVTAQGKLYVLAVGVSLLKNQGQLKDLAKLEYADDDAGLFAKTLSDQTRLYTGIESKILADEKATAGDILDGLDWLKNSVTRDDTAMILMAGHGEADEQGRYTFCAHDYDRTRRLRTGVGFEAIKLALGAIRGQTYLFLDACSAGAGLGAGAKVDVNGLLNMLRDRNVNVITFAGCDGASQSFESDDLKQGVFTWAVCQGLSGQAAAPGSTEVTLFDLQRYVDATVKSQTGNQQVPAFTTPDMTQNRTLSIKVP